MLPVGIWLCGDRCRALQRLIALFLKAAQVGYLDIILELLEAGVHVEAADEVSLMVYECDFNLKL